MTDDERHLWTDDAVSRLPLQQARAELLEEIMSTSTTTQPSTEPVPVTDLTARRRRWLVPAAAAAAVAVLAVLATIPLLSGGDETRQTGPATTAPQPAPRDQMVFTESAWTVGSTSADADEQEVTYELGDASVDVKRIVVTGDITPDEIADDFRDVTTPPSDGVPLEVAGVPARYWSYSDTDRVVATEARDGYRYELRISGLADPAFGLSVSSFELVDQSAFEASLPDDFVLPGEAADAAAEILDGIEGVSGVGVPGGVATPASVEIDPRQFGIDVAAQYACAWFEQYVGADGFGSPERAEAQRVLGTARAWPVLVELGPGDGYVDLLWQLTDRAGAGQPIARGNLRNGLGCEIG